MILRRAFRMLIALVLLQGNFALAYDAVEEFMYKSRLEKNMAEKYSDALATRLPRDQFSVSAQVTLETLGYRKPVSRSQPIVVTPPAPPPAPAQATAPVYPPPTREERAEFQPPAREPAAMPEQEIANQPAIEVTDEESEEDHVINPADLTVGMINAESLLRAHKKEMRALRSQRGFPQAPVVTRVYERAPAAINMPAINLPQTVVNTPPVSNIIQPIINVGGGEESEPKPIFAVKRVLITVGISARFSEQYREAIRDWLNQKVISEFGKAGQSIVEIIDAPPVKTEPPPPAPVEKKKTPGERWLEAIGAIQNLLGLALIAVAGIIAIAVWRTRAVETAAPQAPSYLDHGRAPEPRPSAPVEPAGIPNLPPIQENGEAHSETSKLKILKVRELGIKVAALSFKFSGQLNSLVGFWLEEGQDGFFKTACLIDTINAHGIRSEGAVNPEQISIPKQYGSHMSKVFQLMARVSVERRAEILEEIYWDLVSQKMLPGEKPKRYFSYLRALDRETLEKTLSGDDPRVKALAIYHLSPEMREEVVAAMSEEERTTLFSEAAKVEKVGAEQLEQVDAYLRDKVNRQVMAASDVDFQNHFGDLLDFMTPLEELRILPQLAMSQPDHGLAFRRKRPSLAFVDGWSLRARHLLFASASHEEVAGFLSVAPGFKAHVFEVCPPRVVGIVEGDLANPGARRGDPRTALASLDQRMRQLVAAGAITPDDLVEGAFNAGSAHAA